MRLIAAPGLKVRDHVTRQFIPDEGIEVADIHGYPAHPYWQTLLRHKDVVVAGPPQEAAALPPTAEAAAPEHDPDPEHAPEHDA